MCNGQCERAAKEQWRAGRSQTGQEAHQAVGEGIDAQGEGIGGGSGAADIAKKSPGDLGGQRGRLISAPDRRQSVLLIREAQEAGCRLAVACGELGLTIRTFQRWVKEGDDAIIADERTTNVRPSPANKLSAEERRTIMEVVNSEEFASLPPSQIVPILADRGQYIGSEATLYRLMKEAQQQHHRGRAKKPSTRVVTSHCATAPNMVWSWDITWLPMEVKGKYYYWYMVLDIFSRKIVANEVHEVESAENASLLMKRASLAERLAGRPLVLHSDNGSAMKASTMLATLEQLGVAASFSRPRVSNDNAYAEALFRTCKYRPNYPSKPFENLEQARAWTQQFVVWYNEIHRHSGLKFITPAERHNGQAQDILRKRQQVYEKAKSLRPERWSGRTRNWRLEDEVWLNPERAKQGDEVTAKQSSPPLQNRFGRCSKRPGRFELSEGEVAHSGSTTVCPSGM